MQGKIKLVESKNIFNKYLKPSIIVLMRLFLKNKVRLKNYLDSNFSINSSRSSS